MVSKLLPEEISDYAFPALGQLSLPARAFAVFFVIVLTFLVFFLRDARFVLSRQNRIRVAFRSFAGALACLLLYLAVYQRVVKNMPIGTRIVSVSVGFERTATAKQEYDGASDVWILQQIAAKEEGIQKVWTFTSICITRLSLFLSYMLTLLLLVLVCSLGVLYDSCGPGPDP